MSEAARERRGRLLAIANCAVVLVAVAAATSCTNHPDQAAAGATTRATAGVGLTPGVLDAGPRARPAAPGTTKRPATTTGVSSVPATVLVTAARTSNTSAAASASSTTVANTVVVATHTVPQSTRAPLTVASSAAPTTYPD